MDNRRIEVVSEGEAALKAALSIIWPNAAGGRATHYQVVRLREKTEYYLHPESGAVTHHFKQEVEDPKGVQTLILTWHDERGAVPLPYPMDLDQAHQFVVGWLKQADYGREPDHDGSNGNGWRMFTDGWGHVVGRHFAIVGAQPAWAMYGK